VPLRLSGLCAAVFPQGKLSCISIIDLTLRAKLALASANAQEALHALEAAAPSRNSVDRAALVAEIRTPLYHDMAGLE
jgi:hypothetical protein